MKKQVLYLTLVSFLVLIPWLGIKDLYSRGEAREALVAERMQATKNYILPESYNGTVPSKPPILHWLINSAAYCFGEDVNEYSSRLPSAAASLFFLVFLAIFLQDRVAYPWLPSILLLTSAEWFRASTTARVDCLLSVFTSFALLFLYRWYERSLKGMPWSAIIFLGSAALTKGPVGLLLPCAIFALFLWSEKTPLLSIFRLLIVVGFPSTLIASLWYLQAFGQGGEKFWYKFYYENIARFTSTMDDEPHKHTIFYLYGTMILGFLPWSIPLIYSLWIRRKEMTRESCVEFYRSNSFFKFCILWALGIVFFFSIPSSKRSVYVLPAYPALAVLAAHCLQSGFNSLRLLLHWASITLLGVTLILLVAFLSPDFLLKLGATEVPLAIPFNYCIIIGALLWILKLSKNYQQKELFSFLTALVVILISIQTFFAPAFANAISYRSFALDTFGIVKSADHLYSFADEFYGFSFYLKKQFYSITTEEGAKIPDGFVYLYERHTADLVGKLAPDQKIDILKRSERGVVNKDDHVLLVKVERREG